MDSTILPITPLILLVACAVGLAIGLLAVAQILNPIRRGAVKRMPYESGMDPIHDARRRFDVRFFLLAIAFLVFDVELLFLYPWAAAAEQGQGTSASLNIHPSAETKHHESHPSSLIPHPSPPVPSPQPPAPKKNRHVVFIGAMIFFALLAIGFVYDWRKGVFQWR